MSDARQKTLLLVEDEILIAMMEIQRLKDCGYAMLHVSTGEKALEAVTSHADSVDLILMDIDLGKGMDGTETAQRILDHCDIPILFVSSHLEKDIVEKTETITNYGYVVKNSSVTVLDASIKMAFKLFEAQKNINRKNMVIEATNEELRVTLDSLQKADDQRRISEDKFSKAFKLSPDSVTISRLSDGVMVDVNDGFTQLMGYTREEAVGQSSFSDELDLWMDHRDRDGLVRGLRKSGEVKNIEAEFRCRGGGIRTGLVSARIIEIDGDQCLLSITRDISDRKRIETELMKSELKFRTAFENAPVGITLTDTDGRLRMANRVFCDMVGRSPDELVDGNILNLTDPEDRSTSLDGVDLMKEGKAENVRFLKRYLHRDGHSVWADVGVSALRGDSGKPEFLISTILDITERKKADELLERTQLLLKSIMDIPNDIRILAIDREFTCIHFNRAYYHDVLQRYGVELKVGMNLLESIPHDSFFDNSIGFYKEALSKKPSIVIEHNEGNDEYFESFYNPIVDRNDEVIGATAFATNITSLEITNKLLSESENRLRTMISASPDVIAIVGADGIIQYLSVNVERFFGWKPEDLVGKSGWETVHPEDRERMRGEFDSLLENSCDAKTVECRFECRDGSYRWVEMTAIDCTRNPAIDGILLNYHDVTERKRTDDLLRESEERFREAMEATNDGVWDWDLETGLGYTNPAYYKMLGYTAEEFPLTVRSWIDYLHPDDKERVLAINQDCIENRIQGFTVEYRMRAKDGSWRWILERTKALTRNSRGNAVRMIGTHMDITESRRSTELLKESEEKWRSIISTSPDGITIQSMDGLVEEVSDKTAEMFGYGSREEILGKSIFEFLDPTCHEKASTLIGEMLMGNYTGAAEYLAVKKDGTRFFIEANAEVMHNLRGEITNVFFIIRDISERKKAEEKIRNLLHEKDLVLKEVHHRIKNNMNTVFSLLRVEANAQDDPQTKGILQDSAGRVESMMVLYDKLYRSENVSALPIKDYLPALVNEIVGIFPQRASSRIETILDDFVLSERLLSPLGIIINELITNAMKYAFEGRSDGVITIVALKRDGLISISFQDNGVGLPETVTFQNSTGFGMQLIAMLVDQINGSIRIERERGTKFVIEFASI
jgi:PAS domain S-box-containing protein